MRYCVNPDCHRRENLADAIYCQACRTPLIHNQRYVAIESLRRDHSSLSEVFLVEDQQVSAPHRGRLKVLKTLVSTNPKAKTLFEQEQQLLKTLRHPGIPRWEDDFNIVLANQKVLPGLVMEYIEGNDLEHWLQNYGVIDREQALNWLRQLTEILQYVHQKKHFHRDIKPSNVMRSHTGQLVLIDFGTARQINETQVDGQPITILGTPGYAAPEQWEGRAVPQSDFYGLGMTLIRMLTQIDPDRQSVKPQQWQHHHDVDPALGKLLDQLIARDPAQRPATTTVLLKAIDALQTSHPTTQRRSLPSIPTGRIAGFLVGAIGLVGVGWLFLRVGSRFFSPAVCNIQMGDRLSCGEEMLITQPFREQLVPSEKQEGIDAWRQGDYAEAYRLLNIAWEKQRDPETLIYRNNANIRRRPASNQPIYTIAAVVPITTPDQDINLGLELLRGIAQAQDRAIAEGLGLEVLIADDGNQAESAKEIASKLVNKPKLIGVIGHYASEVTLPVLSIYQNGNLPLISGTATTTRLSEAGNRPDHVFFRTTDTTDQRADWLVHYLNNQIPGKKVAIFYNQGANNEYSKSERDSLVESLRSSNLIKGAEFDLSDRQFNPTRMLEQAFADGAAALAIFPDGNTNPVTFQNALNLISANQGRLLIVGGNTLHTAEVLKQAGRLVTEQFIITVPWNPLGLTNPSFPAEAKGYWLGDVGGKTATNYDATQALIAALKQSPADRQAIREILADPSFRAKGATGEISFTGSDRREPTTVLEKVVPICNSQSFYFVPVAFEQPCYRANASAPAE
ncbi:MAG: bifunctional serine/threonine-protein kinase/ABC transporter substrate-binding protein [Elainella sp. Prado103]|jgi:ABC-type branched-subunit amino acid transport system substrate-binding protein/serine/threonine protein kinase|nr:bifunctional serine/threonine-protein kinase/ABC transporter substrate-binding protein [Elainella sp. Prado103]